MTALLVATIADWLPRLSLLQAIIATIVAASPLGVLAWRFVIKPALNFLRQWKTCVDDVGEIKKALTPNGGNSLYDKVDFAARSSRISQARISTMFDVVVDQPMFEADAKGEFTRVNTAFEKMFETSCDRMSGRGWFNCVIPEDRDQVVREFHHSVADRRALSTMARFVTQVGGFVLIVRLTAQPIEDETTGDVVAWMGTVEQKGAAELGPPAGPR